jgi:hypothetical protein
MARFLFVQASAARHFQQRSTDMTKNEGTLDRTLRVVAGIALIAMAWSGTIGAWGWIGLVPLVTGAVGVCPLYSMLGIRTCPVTRS